MLFGDISLNKIFFSQKVSIPNTFKIWKKRLFDPVKKLKINCFDVSNTHYIWLKRCLFLSDTVWAWSQSDYWAQKPRPQTNSTVWAKKRTYFMGPYFDLKGPANNKERPSSLYLFITKKIPSVALWIIHGDHSRSSPIRMRPHVLKQSQINGEVSRIREAPDWTLQYKPKVRENQGNRKVCVQNLFNF